MTAKVITIAMNKGGVGKTSLISNLVGALTRKYNKKVLILDLDGQGNLSISFGKVPENIDVTIYDALMGGDIKDSIIKLNENLDLIPANTDMSFLEFYILPNFKNYKNPFSLVKDAIASIKDNYDYIFIDTPPSMGLIVGNSLVAADSVIIPYVPEVYAVNGLIRIHKSILDFKKEHNPNLSIDGVIAMMVDFRTTIHQDMTQQAKVYCYNTNINMFETAIPRSIRFASSALYDRKPATWTNKDSHLVSSYYDFLEELIEGGYL